MSTGSQGKTISPATAFWLEEVRGIDPEVASRYGVYTARGNVVAFPFIEDDVEVNEKFRDTGTKKFWQHEGRRRVFWNADVMLDPQAQAGQIIITEGEMDALTCIQAGYPFSMSVPDGAPPPDAKDDVPDDAGGKFQFFWLAKDKLRACNHFVLAVDSDPPGKALAEQLGRRLSFARCSFVTYPDGCKDMNDVLVKLGVEAVRAVIDGAKPYPVRGVYTLSDFPENEDLECYRTGWPLLDAHLKLFYAEFMVVTGIPSHGKSSWAINLLANLCEIHGWKAAVFSPEMRVVPMIRDRLRCLRAKKPIEYIRDDRSHDDWIQANFSFIGPDPRRNDEADDYDLQWVMDRMEEAVLRHGARVVLIDPWNEIEHRQPKGMSTTEYIGASIRALRRLGRLYNLIVIVVAHPTKLTKEKGGAYAPPTLYDISDSAHWYNKADHGIVVHRDADSDQTSIMVVKSRFDEAGTRGLAKLKYDRGLRRFTNLVGEWRWDSPEELSI